MNNLATMKRIAQTVHDLLQGAAYAFSSEGPESESGFALYDQAVGLTNKITDPVVHLHAWARCEWINQTYILEGEHVG